MTDLSTWSPRALPDNTTTHGRAVTLVPFDPARHGAQLWEALGGDASGNERIRYFGWRHIDDATAFTNELRRRIDGGGWRCVVFAAPQTGHPQGMASYMRMDPEHGSIEVGCVAHGAGLTRTPAATEAHYLMARHVFEDLGYRRYEWKLDNRNEASHRAARRFGFTFEGVFRQHRVVPSGNRDTAWYSLLDREWPAIAEAFVGWLDPNNFDEQGEQRRRLESFRRG